VQNVDGETTLLPIEQTDSATGNDRREFAIHGMTCASCAGRVERALSLVPGVVRAELNLATEKVSIEGTAFSPAAIIGAIRDTGYDADLLTGDAELRRGLEAGDGRRVRHDLLQVGSAAMLTAPLLLPMAGVMLPGWLALMLATPVQFVIGGRFYVAAWKALRAGSGNMDLLVALGTSWRRRSNLFRRGLGRHHPRPAGQMAGASRQAFYRRRDTSPIGPAP
jgi:P-type Cu+ transporter